LVAKVKLIKGLTKNLIVNTFKDRTFGHKFGVAKDPDILA